MSSNGLKDFCILSVYDFQISNQHTQRILRTNPVVQKIQEFHGWLTVAIDGICILHSRWHNRIYCLSPLADCTFFKYFKNHTGSNGNLLTRLNYTNAVDSCLLKSSILVCCYNVSFVTA